jgi:hypothetical protein
MSSQKVGKEREGQMTEELKLHTMQNAENRINGTQVMCTAMLIELWW